MQIFFRIIILVYLSLLSNACNVPKSKTPPSDNSKVDNSGAEDTNSPNKASWRNPVMSPMGADISRVVRGYFLVGDFKKMLQFVIVPPCYNQKQIQIILRKSKWGYAIRMTNLQWLEDSTFVITYITTKNNTTGSEQYVGKIVNDTAKIILFPEKDNLFQYHGDENLTNLCELKDALDRIYFEFNSSKILKKSNPALETILAYLKRNNGQAAHLVGHCSEEGSSAYNLKLSEARAKAICDYLIQKGISKDRLSYEGRGDTQPLQKNDSEINKSLNRRVELVLSNIENLEQ